MRTIEGQPVERFQLHAEMPDERRRSVLDFIPLGEDLKTETGGWYTALTILASAARRTELTAKLVPSGYSIDALAVFRRDQELLTVDGPATKGLIGALPVRIESPPDPQLEQPPIVIAWWCDYLDDEHSKIIDYDALVVGFKGKTHVLALIDLVGEASPWLDGVLRHSNLQESDIEELAQDGAPSAPDAARALMVDACVAVREYCQVLGETAIAEGADPNAEGSLMMTTHDDHQLDALFDRMLSRAQRALQAEGRPWAVGKGESV